MVECNTLEVEGSLRGELVDWAFRTDLPVDTIIMASGLRYYEDFDGRHFQWPIFQDRVFCKSISDDLNGAVGSVDLIPSETEAINRVLKIHSGEWKGIRSIVNDALHIRCHLVSYQRERLADFGENNQHLRGPEVYRSGGHSFVTKELSLNFPSRIYERTTRRHP